MLRIGDETLKFDDARERVEKYALSYAATIRYFDFAGNLDGEVHASDGVTLADIGRLTIIDADLDGTDAANLLRLNVDWSSVAHSARLEDADPAETDGLYAAMSAIWSAVIKPKGIGWTKASKLLHIKRPYAFPILDRDARHSYADRYETTKDHWQLIREDLIDGSSDFERLRESLAENPDESVRRASRLPSLRVLDILAWTR